MATLLVHRTGRAIEFHEASVLRTAISGGVGGMALWTAVFPADVVKSRIQITGSGRFSHMFVSILKKEGSFAIANPINLFIGFVHAAHF
uniref:Uncharacterized protein n=1 Tax=Parascaris equorum TaxID=6256 RepID=A0A914RP63_PAREQ